MVLTYLILVGRFEAVSIVFLHWKNFRIWILDPIPFFEVGTNSEVTAHTSYFPPNSL